MAAASVYLMVPMLLRALGPELFGLWSALQSLIAMMAFADFGVGNGMVNAIATANATNDQPELSRTVSSGAFLLTLIAFGLSMVALLAWPILPSLVLPGNSSDVPLETVATGLAIFIGSALISMPLSCGDRVASAMQEGFVLHPIRALAQILAMSCVYLAINLNGGFSAVCLATLAPGVLASAATWGWVVKGRPWLMPRSSHINLHHCKSLFRSGIAFLLIQIIAIAGFNIDTLLIARHAGATAAAEFAVANRFFSLALVLSNIVLAPLWPAYADASARGENGWALRTFLYSVLAAGGVGMAVTGALYSTHAWLLPVWVGDTLVIDRRLLAATAAWTTVLMIGSAVAMFWNGMHWLRLQCLLGLAFVGVSLPIKCWCAQQGNLVAFIVTNLACFLCLELIPGIAFTLLIFRRQQRQKASADFQDQSGGSTI